MSVNADGQPVFHGTNYTHEVTVNGVRTALAESLEEAKVVARAISRALPATQDTRIYAAHANLPHSSYCAGRKIR